MVNDKNLLDRSHIKAEILNYLAIHPHGIQLGTTDVAELALSVGKLLNWLGHKLDGDDVATKMPIGFRPDSIRLLGEQYHEVALAMMQTHPRGNVRATNQLTAIIQRLQALEAKEQV